MSDFAGAVARASEGFCPTCGVKLRKPPASVLADLSDVVRPPALEQVSHCGMCRRAWWVQTVDGRPMLRCTPELESDERRFIYDRGEKG